MTTTDEPQKHVKMPDEPLEIDEEDFYVRAFIKWAIEEQPELKRLEAENAKLRELVADLWEYIYIGTPQDGQSLHDRTRKLGVEVGYGKFESSN